MAAITSQIPPTPGDDEVLLSGNELKETGLPKPSIVKLSKIFTIRAVAHEQEIRDWHEGAGFEPEDYR